MCSTRSGSKINFDLNVNSLQKLRPIKLSVFVALLFSAGGFLNSQTLPEDPENFHIFLLMGQSNMEGGQAVDGPMDTETNPRIFKLYSWGWGLAKDPISNNITQGVGPGLAFAKKLAEQNPDITIGLVPLAKGAQHLNQLSKGTEQYNYALNQAAIAQQKGVIKGILWHQGEHDAIFWHEAITYLERLKTFTNDIRMDLGDIEIPFIVGGLSRDIANSKHSMWPTVAESLKEISRITYKTGYVRSADVETLAPLNDPLHFSVNGQRVMGERYCDEYLRLTGFWTGQAKLKIEAEAEVLEAGWKFHPEFGLFYDANFPIVKHAQLGWVKIEALADSTIRLKSNFFGEFRTLANEPENGIYIYRENIDPELINQPGDIYFVSLLADKESEQIFYNQTTLTWQTSLADEPLFVTTKEHYNAAEMMFAKTQETSDQTIVASFLTDWSEVRMKLAETEENRLFTILYGEEAYQFAEEFEESDSLREFWKTQATDLTTRIDNVLIDAQTAYQNFVDSNFE